MGKGTKQYPSADLRCSSERQLKATKKSYATLMDAMKAAEKKIDPVLAAFNDRVLYLKHNLNSNAIASLKTQRESLEADIHGLIKDMNESIAYADKFIKSWPKNRIYRDVDFEGRRPIRGVSRGLPAPSSCS